VNEEPKARFRYERMLEVYNLESFVVKSEFEWETPEWGFPKGRRNINETDLECSCREFEEETGLTSSQYTILKIKPLYENFIGCNGRPYRHIYYLAQSNITDLSTHQLPQMLEIGDVKWVSYHDGMELIRSYDKEKKRILKVFFNIIKNIIHAGAISPPLPSSSPPPPPQPPSPQLLPPPPPPPSPSLISEKHIKVI